MSRPRLACVPRSPMMNSWSELHASRIPTSLRWKVTDLAGVAGRDFLDLGCGPEPDYRGLEHFKRERIGVDSNVAAVRSASRRVRDVRFIHAEAADLPFLTRIRPHLVQGDAHRRRARCCRDGRPAGGGSRNAPRRELRITDFSINMSDPYFTDRYEDGVRLGMPFGAFVVRGPGREALFAARHRSEASLARIVEDAHVDLALVSWEERPVRTRTGRRTPGFFAIVRRRAGRD
jgi:SAM-dependent methyltransferase